MSTHFIMFLSVVLSKIQIQGAPPLQQRHNPVKILIFLPGQLLFISRPNPDLPDLLLVPVINSV
jgi:hypothetical protein